jgi:hypothetical protein
MNSQANVDQGQRSVNRRSLVLGGLVGASAALCGVSMIAVTALGLCVGRWTNQAVDKSSGPPSATLHVAADGCTMMRSEVESAGPGSALQWVIADAAGRHVLARNAWGENRYTYFRPGKYDVVLQTFYQGRYVDISQHVKIACR